MLLEKLGYHRVFLTVLAESTDPAIGIFDILDWHLILERDGQAAVGISFC